jgi:hypothetical protein
VHQLTAGTALAKYPSGQMFEAVSSGQSSHIANGASPAQAAQLVSVARDAFVHALANSMRLSLTVVAVGIVLAGVLIQGRGAPAHARRVEEVHPEAVAEPLGAQ